MISFCNAGRSIKTLSHTTRPMVNHSPELSFWGDSFVFMWFSPSHTLSGFFFFFLLLTETFGCSGTAVRKFNSSQMLYTRFT